MRGNLKDLYVQLIYEGGVDFKMSLERRGDNGRQNKSCGRFFFFFLTRDSHKCISLVLLDLFFFFFFFFFSFF